MIEENFLQRRGNPMLLSPKEWILIREWFQSQIPSEVVFRAFDRGFEKKKTDEEKSFTSLTYFRRIVKSEFKKYQKSMEGTSPSIQKPQDLDVRNVQEFLARLLDELNLSSQRANEEENRVLSGLLLESREKIRVEILDPIIHDPATDLQRVEQQLNQLEKSIEKTLLQTIPDRQINQWKEDSMRELKMFEEKLEWSIYQEMLQRALIKAIRRHFRIPRLSLFYM